MNRTPYPSDLSEAQWKGTPYIVADDDNQVVYADRDRVYARGALFDQPRYQVFRPGEELREPGSDRYLGTAGLYLGEAILEQDPDPATFTLANTIVPVRAGDRLLPVHWQQLRVDRQVLRRGDLQRVAA